MQRRTCVPGVKTADLQSSWWSKRAIESLGESREEVGKSGGHGGTSPVLGGGDVRRNERRATSPMEVDEEGARISSNRM